MKKTGRIKQCLNCEKDFYAPKWLELNNGAKFCSHKCYSIHKHDEPWNKGIKGSIKKNNGSFCHTEIKWKGTIKEYKSLHHWIGKYLGKPNICNNCKRIETGKRIHWANKSGKYIRDSSDWIRLCAKCHYKFDKTDKRRGI
jgi:hypothetical protein